MTVVQTYQGSPTTIYSNVYNTNPAISNVPGLNNAYLTLSYTVTVTNTGGGVASRTSNTLTLNPVNPAPEANLDVQLTFQSNGGPRSRTTSDTIAGNSAKILSYLGATVNAMFAVVTDATRGSVLQCYNGTSTTSTQIGCIKIFMPVTNAVYTLPSTFTKMCWVKIIAVPTGNSPHYISNGGGAISHYQFTSEFNPGVVICAVGNATIPITSAYTLGTWFHIAQTYTPGGAHAVYLNGALVTSNASSPAFTDSQGVNIAGFLDCFNNTSSNNNTLFGFMDNIRIYASALSGSVISQIYTFESTYPTL